MIKDERTLHNRSWNLKRKYLGVLLKRQTVSRTLLNLMIYNWISTYPLANTNRDAQQRYAN